MRVFALVTDAFGGRGGIAQYNRDLLRSLCELDAVTPITVLPRYASLNSALPAGIRQLPPRRGRIAYTVAALRVAMKESPDVVFCGHPNMAVLGATVAGVSRAKLLIQTHGDDAWIRPGRVNRAAIERADLILCVSRYTRALVLSWASLPPERVLVLPNTVGEAFTPGDGAAARRSLGLTGKRVLLTVGRLDSTEREKGHDRVIAALPGLLARGHDVVYLIAGEGDDGARLEVYAQQAGVADRVRFLGALPSADLIEIYRTADLFVMPSTQEGFGIAFLEAMASGTPAIGLASRGAVDALGEGSLGLAVRECHLAEAIHHLLSIPRRDPADLAAAVRARFGRPLFAQNVRRMLSRLQPGAAQ